MKRIAIYIDTQYESGGTFQYTKSLIYAIDSISSKEISLTLLYTYKNWDTYLNSFLNTNKIFLKKSHLLNKLYKLFIAIGLINILKFFTNKFDKEIRFIENQNFDFVIFPAGDAIACIVNSNVVAAIHDLMHIYERRFRESGGFFSFRFRENFNKQLLSCSKAILVDSAEGERQVKESYETINAKIFILPYIAPDYIYSDFLNDASSPRESISLLKYIFYPAQFWLHKNHLNLLRALKILNEKGIIINLILSGSKNREYGKLIKFVRKNKLDDQVRFSGYINEQEVIDLYKNALALVMPTYYGPTNIPPIEAIILGCPPIVSNIYGMPDQLRDSAIYFDPDNPSEIADKIESLYLYPELREEIIKKGELIKMKFSQERFQRDILNIVSYWS